MKTQLVFDVTDAGTLAASDSVGAYVRSSDGTLITHEQIGSNEHLHVAAALQAGDGTPITDTAGALDVNLKSGDITINEEDVYVHGAAFTSGTDKGSFVLAYREDTLAVDANVAVGDFAGLKVNDKGELWVKDADVLAKLTDIEGDLVDLDIRDLDQAQDNVAIGDGTTLFTGTTNGADHGLDVNIINADDIVTSDVANTAIENTQKDVTTTSGALLASQLADRKYLFVQSLGNKHGYIGKAGITAANGMQIAPKNIFEFRAGPALSFHAVAFAGTQDFRIMELS